MPNKTRSFKELVSQGDVEGLKKTLKDGRDRGLTNPRILDDLLRQTLEYMLGVQEGYGEAMETLSAEMKTLSAQNVAIIETMLDHGASVEAKDATEPRIMFRVGNNPTPIPGDPIILAAQMGSPELVSLLIKRGARLKHSCLLARGKETRRILLEAASKESLQESLEWLQERCPEEKKMILKELERRKHAVIDSLRHQNQGPEI
jgi:hypothetical protein